MIVRPLPTRTDQARLGVCRYPAMGEKPQSEIHDPYQWKAAAILVPMVLVALAIIFLLFGPHVVFLVSMLAFAGNWSLRGRRKLAERLRDDAEHRNADEPL